MRLKKQTQQPAQGCLRIEHQRTTIMRIESRIRYGSVTDPSQAADPLRQRGDPLPQRGEPLPQRQPLAQRGEPLPQRQPLPQSEPLPQRGEPLPQRGEPLPQRREPLPQRPEPLPQRGEPLPRRGEPLPQRGEPLPQRGGDPSFGGQDALPRRTGRTRRSGRHRSPHRLTLPSDAPTLLLAVPGSANPASDQIGDEVAAAARLSCQGADVQVAYLEGSERRLDEALAAPGQGPWLALAVVVPLLAGPQPRADAALQQAAASARGEVVVAEHLGPHPLLAEALHARLAQVGLARESRARGLSISTAANGVLVLADRGDDAVRAAGVAAVLLAGRLAAPAVHASIDDPRGIAAAVERLRAMGASRVGIAPCVIGPETDPRELDAVGAATGALIAPALGAHPAISQLVAMRYGAALVGLPAADSSLG
jgi:sirohydrochlorin ferrochelatase